MSRRAQTPDYASPPLAAPEARQRLSAGALWWILIAGFAARLVVASISWGTTDTLSFLRFAHHIDTHGLLATYRADPLLNHPPLPAYWTLFALLAAGRDALRFSLVFRIPVILADLASALLLRRIALARGASPRNAFALAATYAWNPCAILISAYHGNTDSIYAMLSLLAVYLLGDRAWPFAAGLALGLAVNVKLIPVLLIPPLLLTSRSRREAMLFVAGLAVMALPFVVPLLSEPAFARNVVAYRSQVENWGIPFLLAQVSGDALRRDGPPPADHAAAAYFRIGTWGILVAVALWSIAAKRFARWDRYQVATVAYALFLVLTPGFGVQYLVIVAPLLYFAVSPRLANAYGWTAGLFLLAAYWMYWDRAMPISSLFNQRFPPPLASLALVPWGLLVFTIATIVLKRTPKGRQ